MPNGFATVIVKKLTFNQLPGLSRHNSRGGGGVEVVEAVEIVETADGDNVKVEVFESGEKIQEWKPKGKAQKSETDFEIVNEEGVKRRNPNIDTRRSRFNVALIKPSERTYQAEFERMCFEQKTKGKIKKTGQREKQSKVACAVLVPSPWKFGEVPLSKHLAYFEQATKVLSEKFGRENVLAAQVHFDERTPHLHFTFVPIVKAKDKAGQEVKKVRMSDVWKGFNTFGKLQTEFHREMQIIFPEVKRGEYKELSGKNYVPDINQFRELTAAQKQVAEIETKDNLAGKGLDLAWRGTARVFGKKVEAAPEEVIVKKSDFENIQKQAMDYLGLIPQILEMDRRRRELNKRESDLNEKQRLLEAKQGEVKRLQTRVELDASKAESRLKIADARIEQANAKEKRADKVLADAMPAALEKAKKSVEADYAGRYKSLQEGEYVLEAGKATLAKDVENLNKRVEIVRKHEAQFGTVKRLREVLEERTDFVEHILASVLPNNMRFKDEGIKQIADMVKKQNDRIESGGGWVPPRVSVERVLSMHRQREQEKTR